MEFKEINNYKSRKAISEYDLEQIFLVQYNDLFSKLLLKTVEEFFILLKKQVILHLKIIDKPYDSSLISFFYNKYYYIIQNDKFRIQNFYQGMVTYPEQNFLYLNTLDVYIHCYKCKDAIHKCGNKLIIYDNLFFCLNCKKVYNQNQIKLYCKDCNKTYLTTRRSTKDKRYEYFYSVSFMNYHCFLENEEKIKCLNCGDDLYYNITKIPTEKEQNGIRDIYCINCKLIFDTKQIFFNCKICGENFRCTPQIYRNFSSIKKYLLLLVHTFLKGVYALPNLITNKKCNCNLNGILYYLHNDNGTLFEGKKNGKNVIICDCCFGIFKPDNFSWNFPFCRRSFKSVKSHYIPHRKNNIRIVKNQKDMFYQANSNANNYNNINREYRYNNDYYDSLAYQNENSNFNTSRQLANSVSTNSLAHNRGLSLNANNNKRIYLYDYYNSAYNNSLNNNNMTNAYKNDNNRIFFRIGNYSRNNSHDEYFYNKGRNENPQNYNLNYRNYKLQNHYNNENTNTNTNVNNYNNSLKRSISNFDKIYKNQKTNAFNNNINNVSVEKSYNINNANKNYNNNYYNSVENANINKNNIEIPPSQGMMMKISKSHYNIKQPMKEEVNRIPKNQRKKIFEKKMELNPFKSYNNNNNNINISINNNLIQMNYGSNLNSQKNENNKTMPRLVMNKSVAKISEMKNKYKSQNINNINMNSSNINNRKSNSNSNSINNNEIYKKKKIIEQNLEEKTKKLDLKNDEIKSYDITEKTNNILFRSTPVKIEPRQKIKKENIILRNKNCPNNKINKYNNINIIKDSDNNTYTNTIVDNKNISTNISYKNSIKLDENSTINDNERKKSINNINKKVNTPQVITKIRIFNKEEKSPKNKGENINKIKNNNPRNQSIKSSQVNKIRKSPKQKIRTNDINLQNNKDDISLNNLKKNNNNNIKNMVFIRMNYENEKSGEEKEVINNTEIAHKEILKEQEYRQNNNKKTEKQPIDLTVNKNKSNNTPKDKQDNSSNEIKNKINETNQNKDEYMTNNIVHKKNNFSLNLKNDSKNDFNIKKSEKGNTTIKKIEIINNNINQTNTENSKNISSLKKEPTANKKELNKLNDKINKIVINDINNELNNVVETKLNNNVNNIQNANSNKIKMHNSINYLKNNRNNNNNSKISNSPNKILSKSMKFININTNNNSNNSENTLKNKVKNNIIKHNLIKESNIRQNIDDIINTKSNPVDQKSNLNNNINSNKNENIIANINDNKIVKSINNINLNSINDNKSKNNSNKKINHDNNSNIINNKNININEDINKSPNKKLLGNSIVYKDISKSVNNNLPINNIVDNYINYNFDNNNNNVINTSVININHLNDNNNSASKQINKNINKEKVNENSYINDIEKHPQDSIVKNNQNINNQNITPKKNKIESTNESNNNNNKKIVINNNLIIRQKKKKEIKEDSNVLKLKKYFALMGREKDQRIKRKSSFDCRQSRSHFKLYNNQDNEVKTFDSNYYKIIKPIGKGTYGEIYLVQDPKTSALFALKKIIISDALELRDNQEEYKLTWKLTHANPQLKIVKKYAIEIKKLDKYNLVMYILMEAANCDWEHELLNRQKVNAFYTEIELLTILKSLVETFLVLQNKGISHRDVKPQNILCFGNEGYKLTDFGEAKSRIKQTGLRNIYGFEQNTSKQTVRGTELYMSPILFNALRSKQLDGAQYNAYKSDVFSLGMCFLLASSLNYQSLFEIREVLDMKIIEEVVNKYLGKMYSKKYINLIISMLQTDEKVRPDFIELSSILVKNFN